MLAFVRPRHDVRQVALLLDGLAPVEPVALVERLDFGDELLEADAHPPDEVTLVDVLQQLVEVEVRDHRRLARLEVRPVVLQEVPFDMLEDRLPLVDVLVQAHRLVLVDGHKHVVVLEAIIKDMKIDRLEVEIDNAAIKMIAQRQPMAKDLRIANVYLMPLGGENKTKIIEELNKQKYIFQKFLSKAKLNSKFTPKINFFLDDTFDEAEKIERLLLNKNVARDLDA